MKRLAILPALLLLLAGASSCDKTEVAPATPTTEATDATVAGSPQVQGRAITSTVTGTYPYTYVNNQGQTVTERRPLMNGLLRITNFVVTDGGIVAVGTVSGSTADYGGANLAVQIPLSLSQISSSCSALNINYGPMTFNLKGAVVTTTTNPTLVVTPAQSSRNLLGNLLCSLGVLLRNPSSADTGGVVSHLNRIIAQVDYPTPTASN